MVASNETSNWVASDEACPTCGQRDADLLVWDEDGEQIRCTTCGTVYTPSKGDSADDR